VFLFELLFNSAQFKALFHVLNLLKIVPLLYLPPLLVYSPEVIVFFSRRFAMFLISAINSSFVTSKRWNFSIDIPAKLQAFVQPLKRLPIVEE